ncbi:MAG: cyclase family protein [Elusimicrobia bacterium]|nr:cyclase family protein [Elusimicrobiota bacterium]MDE2236566.1 cyclase family protein [Elusimicrobiota bacterium]MDE2424800.1 cyclase family protein [Elusimicrobiota bacterium]
MRRAAKTRWLDVSVALQDGMVHWPDNPPVKIHHVLDMRRGDHCNLSMLSMGAHTGTHMDAPIHFLRGGRGAESIPYEAGNGPARVLELPGRGAISASELERHKPRRGERLLLKTSNSARAWKTRRFLRDFRYLSTEAASLLARRGLRTLGVDYLSVGGYHRNGAEIHRVLLKAGIWIIEGLDLSLARSGRCLLACLPLKILGGDGAPARAFLRRLGGPR